MKELVRLLYSCLLSLAERGGTIESMNITTAKGENLVSPNGKPRRHILPERLLERILGGKIESEVIHSALERMGGKLIETRTATEGPQTQTDGAMPLLEKNSHYRNASMAFRHITSHRFGRRNCDRYWI